MTVAYVNHGRWVADCPRPECPEAHLVIPDETRTFDCSNCGLVDLVTFPHEVALIEAALSKRPVPQTRNWTPTETVSDLLVENQERGM